MVAPASPAQTTAAFPTAAVEACIREELSRQADGQSLLRMPKPSDGASWEPEIDSLVVVEIICAVEDLLNVKLPETFTPRGGYENAEDCIGDLLSAASSVWHEATKKEKQNV
jgi:acyl carrier protein